jgi:hypothetical protein
MEMQFHVAALENNQEGPQKFKYIAYDTAYDTAVALLGQIKTYA